MMLLDTSGLLAALFPDQHQYDRCAWALAESQGPLLLSPFVLAELDHLITKLAGTQVELDFLAEVERGAYELVSFQAADIARAREVLDQHSDLGIGLADASLVVLSEKYSALDLLTLDEKHFRALRGTAGKPFRILPADA